MNFKILVVDDEAVVRDVIHRVLIKEDYQVDVATSGREALKYLETNIPDLMLLDIRLDDMNGLEVLSEVKRRKLDIIIIMITAYPNVETAVQAMKNGAYDFIQKPFMIEELVLSIRKALETLNLKKEVEALRKLHKDKHSYNKIIGKSAEMEKVLENVKKFGKTDVTVLVEGECGTGKELIAEYIHNSSERFAQPFVRINCGAIPGTLFESELFGYQKGAFTGANKEGKPGLIEQANNGTIFLDEIHAMPAESQVKLLRVLENREYYRVGDPRVHKINIRVIAASNVNLEEEVNSGKFRQDLYFRLNVAGITIPPLRDRKSDIIPLAKYFLTEANKRFGKDIKGLTKEAENVLVSLPLKGNVRELRNMIERVAILSNNSNITEADLILAGIEQEEKSFHLRINLNSDKKNGNVLKMATHKIITKTLEIANGNKTKAAQLLGIPRGTLRHYLNDELHTDRRNTASTI